jgi:hypothetical protein
MQEAPEIIHLNDANRHRIGIYLGRVRQIT